MKAKVKQRLCVMLALLICLTMVPTKAVAATAGDGTYTWPVSASKNISTGFYYSDGDPHYGVDFAVSIGSPVYAVADGTVILATDNGCQGSHNSVAYGACPLGTSCAAVKSSSTGSYANWIIIDHGNSVYSLYAHLKTGTFTVSVGQTVQQGQQIACSGNAGNTKSSSGNGAHLHFELRMGGNARSYSVNPSSYLTQTNVTPSESAPTTATLSIDNYEVRIAEEFTLRLSADISCSFYLSIFNADTGEKVIGESAGSTYTNSFNAAGHYTAYMTAYNSVDGVDSNWIDFYVYGDPPTTATLSVDKSELALGDTVTLTTNHNAYYARVSMSIFLYNDTNEGTSVYGGFASTSFAFTPSEEGTYLAYVTACTHEGNVDSNWVSFTVNSDAPTNGWIAIDKDAVLVDSETITFTYGADDAAGYWIGIDRLGTGRVLTEQVPVSGTYTVSFDQSGIYSAYVTYANSVDGIDTSSVQFVVYEDYGTDFAGLVLNKSAGKPIENSYTEGEKAPVRLANETGYANQLWYFTQQTDGSYTISSCYDGTNMDVRDAALEECTVIQTCANTNLDAQKWYICEDQEGTVLVSKLNKMVVDLANADETVGNYIHTYPYNASTAQIWTICTEENVKLSGPTLSVAPGTSISNTVFTWSEAYGESGYDLKIWQDAVSDGDAYHVASGAVSGYGITLPAGTYQAYVDAKHYYACEASNIVTFTVAEHSHTYTAEVTAPTCVDGGYTTYTCSACGASYTDDEVPATGEHTYVDGVCSVCGDVEAVVYEATLTALEVSFDSEIKLWMYFVIPEELLNNDDAYVLVTKASAFAGDVETKITMAQLREQGPTSFGDYLVEQPVASGEMGRTVTVQIVDGNGSYANITDYADGSVSTEVSRNVTDYAKRVFTSPYTTDAQKKLVAAMLVYGGYSQIKFNVDASDPVYNILPDYGYEIPDLSDITAESITQALTLSETSIGLAYSAQEAYLDSSIYHRVYFKLDSGYVVDDFTFQVETIDVSGTVSTVEVETGYDAYYDEYYVDILDIPAAYLDHMYKVIVTNNQTGETFEVSTSVLVWAKQVMQSPYTTEAQRNLAKATYYYNQAANEFFGK